MEIQFQRQRKREVAAWRKIVWTAQSDRIGWGLFASIVVVAAAYGYGHTWLWICAGIIVTIVAALIASVFQTSKVVASGDREEVVLRTDEKGITLETEGESSFVSWSSVDGLHRFGEFWLFSCEQNVIGSQLIPVEAVKDEMVKEWNEKIIGKPEAAPQQDG